MNTHHHDDLEQLLGRELRGRVDGMDDAPLGLADVRGRASRIRRTRGLVAGGVVAAALAIVVPTVLTAGSMLGQGTGELDPARSPSPSPTPDAPAEVVRTELTLEGLARGEDAAIEYFTPDGVVLPGQGLQRLEQSLQGLVESPADGGWIAISPDGQDIEYLDVDFAPQGGSSATSGFVTTADRAWVAWVAPEPGAQTLVLKSTTDPDAGRVWDLPASPVVEPVDFLAEDRIVIRTLRPDGPPAYAIAEPDGSTTELTAFPDVQAASSANGLLAVQTTARPDGSGCFGVVDPAASLSGPVWETCDHSLGAFSPDGRYVMASDSYLSGLGLSSISVLDAQSGDLVAEFSGPRNTPLTLVAPSWEDGDSIVASALGLDAQVLLRLGVDGTMEDASGRVPQLDADVHFYLGRDRARL